MTIQILALETATEWCSAALFVGGECLEDKVPTGELPTGELRVREAHAGNRHSELILPMVQAIMAEEGIALTQLDAIAYGEGPGSFTGLRIACGVTQGLALAAGCPIIGIGSLHALAAAAALETDATGVLAILDARMGEVYAARYRDGIEVLPPALYKPEALPPPLTGECVAGTGFFAYETLLDATWAGLDYRVSALHYPGAAQVARLAVPRFLAGEGRSAEWAEPVYVRNKVALKKSERP